MKMKRGRINGDGGDDVYSIRYCSIAIVSEKNQINDFD